MAVLALNLSVGERRARAGDVPGKKGVLAVGKSGNDIGLAGCLVAERRALFAASLGAVVAA